MNRAFQCTASPGALLRAAYVYVILSSDPCRSSAAPIGCPQLLPMHSSNNKRAGALSMQRRGGTAPLRPARTGLLAGPPAVLPGQLGGRAGLAAQRGL